MWDETDMISQKLVKINVYAKKCSLKFREDRITPFRWKLWKPEIWFDHDFSEINVAFRISLVCVCVCVCVCVIRMEIRLGLQVFMTDAYRGFPQSLHANIWALSHIQMECDISTLRL